MKGVSLFSSAGIAEFYFDQVGIDIIAANELIEERANLYSSVYKNSTMISGNILDKNVFKKLVDTSGKKIDFLIASPPCQGMSMAGKSRNATLMLKDERNFLVLKVIEFITLKNPKFVLIENVPNFLKLKLPFNGKLYLLPDLLTKLFGDKYNIEAEVLDAADFGVPQRRTRAIIKLYKKGEKWGWTSKQKQLTVKEAIGHLPSIESGQESNIKWHFARKHSDSHVLWLKHTPTGHSAFENKKYFPVKDNGEIIKSYMTTYRRIKWDEPAPTITMRNDAISSQLNVHPGRKLKNGTYSDARVLTPLELMILSSLPDNWNIPDNTPESLIRKCIGECIPPLLIKSIVSQISN
jgi:DNA (cytosine-5)-methyltransferase 1